MYVSLLGMANIKITLFLSLQINTCTGIWSLICVKIKDFDLDLELQ